MISFSEKFHFLIVKMSPKHNKLLKLCQKFNNYYLKLLYNNGKLTTFFRIFCRKHKLHNFIFNAIILGLDSLPFVVEGQQVGLIKENVKSVLLLKYPEVFCLRDYHDTKKVSQGVNLLRC